MAGGALAILLASGIIGTAAAIMSLSRGDGPEFPY